MAAVTVGGLIFIPRSLSVYNFGQRLKRAERLADIEMDQTIKPVTAFLLFFPGGLLIVPSFIHYWYITKHQNAALRAAGAQGPWRNNP